MSKNNIEIRYSDSRGNWFAIRPDKNLIERRIQEISSGNCRTVYVWDLDTMKCTEYAYGLTK